MLEIKGRTGPIDSHFVIGVGFRPVTHPLLSEGRYKSAAMIVGLAFV